MGSYENKTLILLLDYNNNFFLFNPADKKINNYAPGFQLS